MKKFDVLLIGSGISSLISALLLAKSGRSVAILEQHWTAGGYMHSFKRKGVHFDTGIHYIGGLKKGAPFHTLLQYLNVFDEELFFSLDPNGMDILSFPSFKVEVACSYQKTIENFVNIFPQQKDAIKKYFDLVYKTARIFPSYEYNNTVDEISLSKVLNLSLLEVLDGLTTNIKLKSALSAYCCLHGVAPQDVAFGIHAVITDSLLQSAHGPRLGGQAIVNKFTDELKRLGGQIFLNEKVISLHIENMCIKRVITEKQNEYEAEWIISGIHPKNIFEMVRSHLKKSFTSRIDNIEESLGFMALYGKSVAPLPLENLKNHYFFQYENPHQLFNVGTPTEDPSFLFMCHAYPSESVQFPFSLYAPAKIEWFETWRSLKWKERRDKLDYLQFKQLLAQNMINSLYKYCPSMNTIDWELCEVSTPLTNYDFNGSINGSAYGIYHSIKNTGARALGPRTHIRNLLLTGQSTLFPGLLGAAISGLRSCGHILGIKHLLGELKELQNQNRMD